MNEEQKKQIEECEKQLGHATGIGAITRGQCPRGMASPAGCMFCPYGHMLDCHYPKTCKEANCGHYQIEKEGT
jgi:hypothetical protein